MFITSRVKNNQLPYEIQWQIANDIMRVVVPMLLIALCLALFGAYIFVVHENYFPRMLKIVLGIGISLVLLVCYFYRKHKPIIANKIYIVLLLFLVCMMSLFNGTIITPPNLMIPIAIFAVSLLFLSLQKTIIIQLGIVVYYALVEYIFQQYLTPMSFVPNDSVQQILRYTTNLLLVLGTIYAPFQVLNRMFVESIDRNKLLENSIQALEESRGKELQSLRDKNKLQEQLNQAQKMEAVGLLAGGVAHDFNNALAGIIGAAELLQQNNYNEQKKNEYINLIIKASARASKITKKLLEFSRVGTKIKKILDCRLIIEDTIELLKYSRNKNINISIENKSCTSRILGDDSLLQNAFLNIGINACHAMPNGGNLKFTLTNQHLDEEYCQNSIFDLQAGLFLSIEIEDTGVGIEPHLIHRIFEPFFTTKGVGQGTGLGMSAVYGTVKEHSGEIKVESEVGIGTCFQILLPISADDILKEQLQSEVMHHEGIILLIDDEEIIRIVCSAMIENLGYEVITASDGVEGLKILAETQKKINLVILDMIMPKLNGKDVFNLIQEMNVGVPVVIASGYSNEDELEDILKMGVAGVLNKPYSKNELELILAKHIL